MKPFLLASVFALACTPGPAGPPGPAGEPGEPGAGATGRLVWRDATGAVVGHELLIFQDAAGQVWNLDVETARPSVDEPAYYSGAGCTGDTWTPARAVAQPFRFGGGVALVKRPPTLLSQTTALQSQRTTAGACQAFVASLKVLPAAQLVAAQPEPAWPFVPPLRVERQP